MRPFLFASAVAVLFLPPWSLLASGETLPLAGTSWRPVSLSGMAGATDQPVHVAFQSAEKVTGFSGCNRFFGTYRQKGDRLQFGPLSTTRIACPPEIMQRERMFLEFLAKTRLVESSAAELALKSWEGAVFLRLEPHD